MNPNVVILASYPKSGNTWLRLLLANLVNQRSYPIPINAIEFGSHAANREKFDQYSGWEGSDLSDGELDLMWPDVYRRWAAESQRTLFLKSHTMLYRNAAGEWIYPCEIVQTVLHLARHPFDVAVSLANHCGCALERAVDWMLMPGYIAGRQHDHQPSNLPEHYGSWAEFNRSWLAPDRPCPLLSVRYEDLKAEPSCGFGQLARAAGVVFSPEKLAQAIDACRFDRLQAAEAEFGFRERAPGSGPFFRAGRSGTWRGALSQVLRSRLVESCGDLMEGLGYGENGEILDRPISLSDENRVRRENSIDICPALQRADVPN